MADSITDQQIDDILGTALDSGIYYWADQVSVIGAWPEGAEFASDVVSRNSTLAVLADGKLFYLTKGMLLAGIVYSANYRGLTVSRFLDDHDAEDADLAVQYALFGDVIYG